MEDDKETDEHEEVEVGDEAELKKHLVIVKDDDIAIDAIPLATKPLVIVEYKLLKEGIMVHYQLIRADRSSKRYSSMIRMLQGIDKEYLETFGMSFYIILYQCFMTVPLHHASRFRLRWGVTFIDYDHEMIPKSKDWVERHNPDSKLPNFNTRRILVPEIQVVNECLKLTEATNDLESSKESGSEPQTPSSLLKVLQRASPSSEVMPLTYQEHSPMERPSLGTMKHTKPDIQESSSKSVS
ncbi:hypothetical protein Tco_0698026 [Tanacetum coccineum]